MKYYYLLFVIGLMIFGIVKLVRRMWEKAKEPKTAEEALTRRIQNVDSSYLCMETIAKYYATGEVKCFDGEDQSIPKDLKEAERWYAMALEEELTLRVEHSMVTFECTLLPFENAVLRYCDGKLFPRDLDKAMSVAKYLVRRNVAMGGELMVYVRQLMAGKESHFTRADWSGAWEQELRFFKRNGSGCSRRTMPAWRCSPRIPAC